MLFHRRSQQQKWTSTGNPQVQRSLAEYADCDPAADRALVNAVPVAAAMAGEQGNGKHAGYQGSGYDVV